MFPNVFGFILFICYKTAQPEGDLSDTNRSDYHKRAVYVSGLFLTLRNMFIIAAMVSDETKARCCVPTGGRYHQMSLPLYIIHIRSSRFITSTPKLWNKPFKTLKMPRVQLWHFYSGEVIAIIDSSYYGEWKHTHTHTSLHTCIHANTHTHTLVCVCPEMQLWGWMLPLWRLSTNSY